MDGQTDGWMDRQMDGRVDIQTDGRTSYGDALTQLKIMQMNFLKNLMFPQNLDEILGGEI